MLIHEPTILQTDHWADACVTAARGVVRSLVRSFENSGRCESFCRSRRWSGSWSMGWARSSDSGERLWLHRKIGRVSRSSVVPPERACRDGVAFSIDHDRIFVSSFCEKAVLGHLLGDVVAKELVSADARVQKDLLVTLAVAFVNCMAFLPPL